MCVLGLVPPAVMSSYFLQSEKKKGYLARLLSRLSTYCMVKKGGGV